MFDVLDQLIGPLNTHIAAMLLQPISGTDDQHAQLETKKAYIALLNNIMASKLQAIFISERKLASSLSIYSHSFTGNYSGFESLIEMMQGFADNVSDPANQKGTLIFFSRCVTTWGRDVITNGQAGETEGLPGFERFIYERLIPTTFRVPSLPNFNPKDGQMIVVSCFILATMRNSIKSTGSARNCKFTSNYLQNTRSGSIYLLLKCVSALSKLANRNGRRLYNETSRSRRKGLPKILYRSHSFLPLTVIAYNIARILSFVNRSIYQAVIDRNM